MFWDYSRLCGVLARLRCECCLGASAPLVSRAESICSKLIWKALSTAGRVGRGGHVKMVPEASGPLALSTVTARANDCSLADFARKQSNA